VDRLRRILLGKRRPREPGRSGRERRGRGHKLPPRWVRHCVSRRRHAAIVADPKTGASLPVSPQRTSRMRCADASHPIGACVDRIAGARVDVSVSPVPSQICKPVT
jgi:hypothetical protein